MEHCKLIDHKWLENVRCGIDLPYNKLWYEVTGKLVKRIEKLIPEEDHGKFRIDQIKEKFGGLRFYWDQDGLPDPVVRGIDALVDWAELIIRNDFLWKKCLEARGCAEKYRDLTGEKEKLPWERRF